MVDLNHTESKPENRGPHRQYTSKSEEKIKNDVRLELFKKYLKNLIAQRKQALNKNPKKNANFMRRKSMAKPLEEEQQDVQRSRARSINTININAIYNKNKSTLKEKKDEVQLGSHHKKNSQLLPPSSIGSINMLEDPVETSQLGDASLSDLPSSNSKSSSTSELTNASESLSDLLTPDDETNQANNGLIDDDTAYFSDSASQKRSSPIQNQT